MAEMLSKRLKISELPEPLKQFMSEDVITDKALVWLVAKEGQNNDFAVYIGNPDIEYIKPEFKSDYIGFVFIQRTTLAGTLAYGSKVSESLARILFPEFGELEYRV